MPGQRPEGPDFSASSDNARQSVAAGIRDQKEIESHLFAQFAQLVPYGFPRVGTGRIRQNELKDSLEGGVFAHDFQKAAVLKITAGPEAGNGKMILAQRRSETFLYGSLYHLPNGPEASREKKDKGDETEQESACSEPHRSPLPV
jgi:hypothetical protein